MGNDVPRLSAEEIKNRQIQKVDLELRRKMQKGTRYNMKVILKGERNCGKSMLFKRLQGQPFSEAYIPSTAISTAHIHWNYKVSDDNVVVEVWDVVDKGKLSGTTHYEDAIIEDEDETPTSEQLQLKAQALAKSHEFDMMKHKQGATNSPSASSGSPMFGDHQLTVIDAHIVDVYKHCNAVLLVFDITKPWTWEYVKNEFSKVPSGVEIAVLANCKDLESKRVVTQNEVQEFCSKRGVSVIECSSLNCYGLKNLYTWLNIPFLKMKINITKQQLQLLEEELDFGKEEVDLTLKASNYNDYLQMLKETKKKTTIGFTEELVNRKTAVRKSVPANPPQNSTIPQQQQMHPQGTTTQNQPQTPPPQQPQTKPSSSVTPQPTTQPPKTTQPPPSATTHQEKPKSGGFFSAALSYFGGGSSTNKEQPQPKAEKIVIPQSTPAQEKVDLNTFYAGDAEEAFYSDEGENNASTNVTTNRSLDDDEESITQPPKKTVKKKGSKKKSKTSKKVDSDDEIEMDEVEDEDDDDTDRPMMDQSVNESMEELYVPMAKQSFRKTTTTSSSTPTKKQASPATQQPQKQPEIKKEIPTLSKEEIADDDAGFYSDDNEESNKAPTHQDEHLDSFYNDNEEEDEVPKVQKTQKTTTTSSTKPQTPVTETKSKKEDSFYDDEEDETIEAKPSVVETKPVATATISPPQPIHTNTNTESVPVREPLFSSERFYDEDEEASPVVTEKPKKKKATKKKSSATTGEATETKKKVKKKKAPATAVASEEASVSRSRPATGYEEI
ncbi:hypothetical protein C9374_005597 [Naegleria lovaniensis]|uniref:Uncharacterized protein n=1 Tax=Naegleria lovaniensis TaxID=51637 RepID=A0AA88GQT9_NAELO|nr:uncharacterized protein C9374_005597 [Naegleria lovaniensis]KAG2382395.1 hypothetical protein C9374_005597 [Naegleria lovaniensis]